VQWYKKNKCTLLKCHTNASIANSHSLTQLPHKFLYIVAILTHNHFESPNRYLKMFSNDDRTDMILLTHYFCDFSCRRPEFGKLQISKSSRNTCIAGLVRLKVGILSCHRFRLAFVIRILSNVNVCSVDGSLKMFFYL
jgi:hypothetical protein